MAAGNYFGLEIPFLDLVGVHAEETGEGRSRISVDLRPELTNSFAVAHGGVVMTLLDVAMAVAARSTTGYADTFMTVDMSVTFLRAAQGRIVAEGRVLRGGSSIYFCEAEARDGDGELLAKSMGTFKLRRAKAYEEKEGGA